MHIFLNHENWLEKQPTLKSIFDNLRNYPLLAIYFAVTWSVMQKGDSMPLLLGSFMFFVLGGLLVFSLAQTCMLFSAIFFHAFFPEIEKTKKISLILGFIFTFLFGYAMFFSLGIVTYELVSTYVAR